MELSVKRDDPFRPGASLAVRNPRRSFAICEEINLKKGRSALLHLHGCRHCMALVDACHDAALLYEPIVMKRRMDD